MGRKQKTGLEYFPFDSTFFSDIKIRKLIKYQGSKSLTVYINLLCNIYSNGYYIKWDNELPFIISESTGCDEAYILEVIKCCLTINLFNKHFFDEKNILTSKGIQERFNHVCKILKRSVLISEFSLIDSEEMYINSEETIIDSVKSAQSKVKESKVKETKINESESHELFSEVSFELKNSEIWLGEMCRIYKKSKEFLDQKLSEFLDDLKAKDDFYKGFQEIKKHFVNWLKIEINKEKVAPKNLTNGKPESKLNAVKESASYVLDQRGIDPTNYLRPLGD